MFRINAHIQNVIIRDWLQDFFRMVDSNRLARGKRLYTSGAVLELVETDRGFSAEVAGSRKAPYEIDVVFFDSDRDEQVMPGMLDLPDLDEFAIHCSCPDAAWPCKHATAVVIHWAVLVDQGAFLAKQKKRDHALLTHSEHKVEQQVEQQKEHQQRVHQQLQQLRKHAKQTPPTILHLPNPSFWAYRPPLNEWLEELHKIRNRTITKYMSK